MSTARRVLGPVVAGLLAAAGAVVGASATAPVAQAAVCGGSTGVTVVVDFNELGGTSTGCDANGGTAASNFEDAGFPLTYVSNDPGFVCRVSGQPSNAGCARTPPADAYWGLWWSDGKSGTWSYATTGVGGLKVPEGGYVGFSWHQGDGKATAPGVSPTPRQAPAPAPSTTAGGSGAKSGSGKGGSTSGSGGTKSGKGGTGASTGPRGAATPSVGSSVTATATPTASASASAAAKKKRKKQVEPTASALTSSATPQVEAVTAGPPDTVLASDDDAGGFPVWAAGLLAVVVLGAAGAVPIIRARR